MTERELFKAVIEEELLSKDAIFQGAVRAAQLSPAPRKGAAMMKKRVIILAAALVCLLSVTALAVGLLLSPKEAANALDAPALAQAFENGDAVTVNQTVTKGGYKATFLGVAAGQDLAPYGLLDEEGAGQTYAVVAIEHEDGTPMTMEENLDFCVSPLVKGLEPWQHNIATMGGAFSARVIDGVYYRLAQCDDVSVFAYRGLYLAVLDQPFIDGTAYTLDADGALAPSADYTGLNALFPLPIPADKADPAAAQAYLDAQSQPAPEQEPVPGDEPMTQAFARYAAMDPAQLPQLGTLVQDSQQTLVPDAEGRVRAQYEGEAGGVTGGDGHLVSELFPGHSAGWALENLFGSGEGTQARLYASLYHLDEAGVLTWCIYQLPLE